MLRHEQRLKLPTKLTSPQTKRIYLHLTKAGEATVTELHHALVNSKITLLPILEPLAVKTLIQRMETGYVPQ